MRDWVSIRFAKLIRMKLIFLFFLTLISNNLWANETIVLGVGAEKLIKINPGTTIRLTNSKITLVQDLGRNLRLVGKRPGDGLLLIQGKSYEIKIIEKPQFMFYQSLIPILKNMMGLEVDIVNKQVVVRGELLRFSDWQKISKVARENQAEWFFFAKMSKDIEQEANKYFTNLIFKNQLPVPSILFQPQPLVLVPKENESLKTRYSELLKTNGFKVETSVDSISTLPVIEIAVQIAELKKSEFLKIGIQPPPGITGSFSNGSALNIDPSQFEITLHAMQSKGEAKILANPRLICRSGKEAQFLAGGEFPIKIFNYKISDIHWKKHGIVLNIKPNADHRGRMSLYVNAEISIIDNAHVVDGIPGLLVNRVETYIDLTESKTIALSGLIKQDWGKTRAGIPLLSDIPILNNLFSSEDFRNEHTDLVIFLTPKLLKDDNG